MEITLRIDGKDKTFTNDFVKARILKEALKMNEEMKKDQGISAESLDRMIEFVVIAFDKQFTIDEVWEGIEVSKLQSEITRVFNEVLNLGGLEVKGDTGK